jgi:hypothetical protein
MGYSILEFSVPNTRLILPFWARLQIEEKNGFIEFLGFVGFQDTGRASLIRKRSNVFLNNH